MNYIHLWFYFTGVVTTIVLLIFVVMLAWSAVMNQQWVRLNLTKDEYRHRFVCGFNKRPWSRGFSLHVPPFKRHLFIRLESVEKWRESEHFAAWKTQQTPQYISVEPWRDDQ